MAASPPETDDMRLPVLPVAARNSIVSATGPDGVISRSGIDQVTAVAPVDLVIAAKTLNPVIGIAARNDEHIQVITRLTNALDEPGLVDRLASTQDPQEFLDLLGAEQAA